MPLRRVSLRPRAAAEPGALREAFTQIRAEFDVPGEFPADVLAEASAAAAADAGSRRDETSVPFFTIDPPGSLDLDQAMALDRDGDGYRVRYAVADVPAFVAPGSALDAEARRRVQTYYLPDGRAPLHPPQIGEGAASLLPRQVRPAYVWDLRLDSDGELGDVQVYRARVRSRDRLDYEQVQRSLEAGAAPEPLTLLREIGQRRIALELHRGGASLPMPEQEVDVSTGGYVLRLRPPVPAEDWNAHLSLATGMAAATMMLHGQVGILRTMPPPDPQDVRLLHRQARVLGVEWPAEQAYGAFLRGLDRTDPAHLAVIYEATTLFRGAAYTPFVGDVPEQSVHAAVAMPYAHVTAPLRRLVDRFGLVVCAALSAGAEVPDWARAALPELPALMRAGDRRAGAVERACADAVEAAELTARVGDTFAATVVADRGERGVLVQLLEPAVVALCSGRHAPGTTLQVRLVEADVATRTVRFEAA